MRNTINKLTNKKSKTTTITKLNLSNENVTENSNEIAHTFNTYFNTIGENLANELPNATETSESYVTPSNSTFQLKNVSEVDVFHLLNTLKISIRHVDTIKSFLSFCETQQYLLLQF